MRSVFSKIRKENKLLVPDSWMEISTIDMHTGGEPLRVILDGFPELKGKSVLDFRRHCKNNYDHLRKTLMFEPRGHADMYGCIITPPNNDEADFGIIFLHNEGYSTMCGHAIIAISTLAAHQKWVEVSEGENEIKIDAPCGRINAYVKIKDSKVLGVKFHNVPSFVAGLNQYINVPGLGKVNYDLAYGGAFYAYVDMAKNGFSFDLSKNSHKDLIDAGMKIKNAVQKQDKKILHPFESDLSFLYGTIFIGEAHHEGNDSRNVCIFAEGELDRSPTGSGVSGRMALHFARNELKIGESMLIESITDSVFRGSVVREVAFGDFKAIIPEIEGSAHFTGTHTFLIDPADPMKDGFILR